jgi:hypothetical protein
MTWHVPSSNFRRPAGTNILARALPVVFAVGIATSDPAAAQQVRAELLWEVGAVDGPPETVWEYIIDGVVAGDRVVIADARLGAVRQFNLSGRFIRELGRPGQGPGEFGQPTALAQVPSGVAVYDRSLVRWSTFDPSGRLVSTTRVAPPDGYARLNWARSVAGGWTIALTPAMGGPRLQDAQASFVAWQEPSSVTRLAEFPAVAINFRYAGTPNPSGLQLGPSGGGAVLGDSMIVLVDGSSSTATLIRVTRAALHKVRTVTLPGRATSVSAQHRAILRQRFEQRWSGNSNVTDVRIPETWPAWTRIEADENGIVWVRRGGGHTLEADPREHWVGWSTWSDRMSQLVLPPNVQAVRFQGDWLIARRKGEFDVEYLQLYRMTR